jgi:hypothetical protein
MKGRERIMRFNGYRKNYWKMALLLVVFVFLFLSGCSQTDKGDAPKKVDVPAPQKVETPKAPEPAKAPEPVKARNRQLKQVQSRRIIRIMIRETLRDHKF